MNTKFFSNRTIRWALTGGLVLAVAAGVGVGTTVGHDSHAKPVSAARTTVVRDSAVVIAPGSEAEAALNRIGADYAADLKLDDSYLQAMLGEAENIREAQGLP